MLVLSNTVDTCDKYGYNCNGIWIFALMVFLEEVYWIDRIKNVDKRRWNTDELS